MSRQYMQMQTIEQTETDDQSSRFVFTSAQNTTEAFGMASVIDSRISVHLMKALNTMRENQEYCDLIFELNNSKFSAHRLVIAVWSPPMKNLLQFQSACTQHIRLAYDKPEVFHKFITFLYTGVLPEQVSNIPAVLLLAATFQIHLLTDLCKELLKASTTVDNVISMYHLGIKFQLPDLEVYCVEFLCQYLTEIVQKDELRALTPTQINFFLGSEHISNLDPEIKLFLIISWLAEDVSSREKFLVLLLKHIDWSAMATDFLKEIIQTDNFFTSNPSSLYLLLQTLHSSSFCLGPYESHFWALRQQYSYLLNSVVSSSVALASGKPKLFQPLSFSIVSSPTEEQMFAQENKNETEIIGVKHEPSQSMSCDKCESCIHHDTTCSDVEQNNINANQDIPASTCSISEIVSVSKTSSQNLCSQNTEKIISEEGTTTARIPSAAVEIGMKRTCLRSYKAITDPDKLKSRALKVHHKKKNGSKLHNTRGKHRKGRAHVLGVITSENSTEDHHNADDTREDLHQYDVAVEKKLATAMVENIDTNETRNHFHEQNVRRRKMITQLTSRRIIGARSARNIKSGLKNKLVNPKKGNRTKKDAKLQIQKCSQCEFTTYNCLMLEKHQKQVHEGNCLLCCSLCSFKSKWSKEYYDHMKQSHFPGPPFQCDEQECEYSTDKFQELMSHRKQHSDQRPFVCDICLTAFRSINNLYQHLKIHSDEKKFECPECGRCFKLKNTLEQHMVTHSDLRPYLCDLCGFSTKFQSHLICHKRIHTGDVYYCNFPSCVYSTPKKSQLKSHMRSHLGIRRHVCSTCGKAFVEKSHLIRHERTHSSERAYVCMACDYSSTRADKLREHIQKHHSDDAVRVKSAASTKKSHPSGTGKVKKTPKASSQYRDGVEVLVSNPGNIIDGVVMKSNAAVVETVLPNVLTDSDVNTRLVQALPYQPLVSQEAAVASGVSLSMAPKIENIISSRFRGTAKSGDVTNTEETSLGYQITDGTTGGMASLFSMGDDAIVDCSSIVGDKATVAGEIISQHYQQHIAGTSHMVPSYPVSVAATPHFSKPSSQFEQAASASQLAHGHHHLITLPSATSSTGSQQYYPSQLHGNQQQHQEMEQLATFSSVANYLY